MPDIYITAEDGKPGLNADQLAFQRAVKNDGYTDSFESFVAALGSGAISQVTATVPGTLPNGQTYSAGDILLTISNGSVVALPKDTTTTNTGATLDFQANDVAFIAVGGQSNAAGVNGAAASAPLANVFVIGAGQRNWVAYNTTDSNIYATNGSNKSNPLTEIASNWQARIDNGESLPDLYILNVSRGGASMSHNHPNFGTGRWNPNCFKSQSSTPWNAPQVGVVDADVCMFSLLKDAMQAGVASLTASGKRVLHLATIWNQWEGDAVHQATVDDYPSNLSSLQASINATLGVDDATFWYWRPRATLSPYSNFLGSMQTAFDNLRTNNSRVFEIDVFDSPDYDASAGSNIGIFDDGLHYTQSVQQWAAEKVLSEILADKTTRSVV